MSSREKESLVRSLNYVYSEWQWERFCRDLIADELGKAHKKIYGNINQSQNHQSRATRSAQVKDAMK
jgi:hypothetical protein